MNMRALLVLLSTLQLGACAIIPALEGDLNEQLDRSLAENDYTRALDIITYVREDHPDYTRLVALRPSVEARAKAFEQAQIRRAAELTAQGDWAAAIAIYREAIGKLPHSTALRTELQAFRRRQANRIEELKIERLVVRARWLERAITLQRAIVQVDPDDWIENRQLERYQDEASELATDLTRIGSNALEKENLGVAARTLPIAARLSPSPSSESAKDRLSQAEAAQVQEQRRSRTQALEKLHQRETTTTLAEYRKALETGNLRRARQLMMRLSEIDGQDPEVQDERRKFEGKLDQVLRTHLESAISLYGRGNFDEAITHWKRVLEIDPEHEQARAGVERAERVMQKLKELREKQTGTGGQHTPLSALTLQP